jgi:hypothetical protein
MMQLVALCNMDEPPAYFPARTRIHPPPVAYCNERQGPFPFISLLLFAFTLQVHVARRLLYTFCTRI